MRVRRVDIVYCDSWMSYGIAPAERAERLKALMPYQVWRAAVSAAEGGGGPPRLGVREHASTAAEI